MKGHGKLSQNIVNFLFFMCTILLGGHLSLLKDGKAMTLFKQKAEFLPFLYHRVKQLERTPSLLKNPTGKRDEKFGIPTLA